MTYMHVRKYTFHRLRVEMQMLVCGLDAQGHVPPN